MDHHMTEMNGLTWPVVLAWVFLAGVLFYVFRLFNPNYLKKVNGYIDSENEFWHAACLLSMVDCLVPALIPVSDWVWLILFPVGVVWYLIRAFTYGKKLTYNKQWYDLAHAAMLFGMWWMFAHPVEHVLITVVLAAYWCWFGSYYVWRTYHSLKKLEWLSIGQDAFHLTMAVVMALMTLWPHMFMGHCH